MSDFDAAAFHLDPQVDNQLMEDIEAALAADHTILVAARRLVEAAEEAVHQAARDIDASRGWNREVVYRCILVRTHKAFSSLLTLVENGFPYNARLLLRPMAEDHIFLGWLSSLDADVADEFVRLRALDDLLDGCEVQHRFLPRAYADMGVDPVPPGASGLHSRPSPNGRQVVGEALKRLGKPLGWRARGPTVRQMAEESDRLPEYDFFYRASSRSVHSNLHEMGQMVSGDAMGMTVSNERLSVLHSDFAIVYGTWLYGKTIFELARWVPTLRAPVESMRWSVWIAIVQVGMARNGRLPPIVSDHELRWAST